MTALAITMSLEFDPEFEDLPAILPGDGDNFIHMVYRLLKEAKNWQASTKNIAVEKVTWKCLLAENEGDLEVDDQNAIVGMQRQKERWGLGPKIGSEEL